MSATTKETVGEKQLQRNVSSSSVLQDAERLPSSGLSVSIDSSLENDVTLRGRRRQGLILDEGHAFGKAPASKTCAICAEKGGRIVMCGICGLALHARCKALLLIPCREAVCERLQGSGNGFPHWWRLRNTNKSYFCNVCRLPIKDKKDRSYNCISCGSWAHGRCLNSSINNCRQTMNCPLFHDESAARPYTTHFLVEGNLSVKKKCAVCNQSCANKNILTGFRCQWCGIQVHTKCMVKSEYHRIPCNFGALSPLILRPWVVIGVPGYRELDNWCKETLKKSAELMKQSEGKKIVTVYEGPNLRGRSTSINVDGNQKIQSLLVTALNKFGVEGPGSEFYLEEVQFRQRPKQPQDVLAKPPPNRRSMLNHLSTGLTGGVVNQNMVIPNASFSPDSDPSQQFNFDVLRTKKLKPNSKIAPLLKPKPLSKDIVTGVFVRSATQDDMMATGKGTIRVYAAPGLDAMSTSVSLTVDVTHKVSYAVDTAKKALKVPDDMHDLFLEEVSCVDGVSKGELNNDDPVFRSILKHVNSHINEGSMRLCLNVRQKEASVPSSLYISGFSKHAFGEEEKTQEDVRNVLANCDVKDWSIDITLPAQGIAIINVNNSKDSDEVSMELRNAGLTVTHVPNLDMKLSPPGSVPVLVCLNGKSGAGQGVEINFKLNSVLNPEQVFDITKTGPLQAILVFRKVPEFRILAGGGDGTVGWVLNSLNDVRHVLECKQPGVAILPIGTGNDLSRVLGWGPGYEGERLEPILASVLMAQPQQCDRWNVNFTCKTPDDQPDDLIMTNYFGIGLDAYIAMGFHEKREAHPEKFTSRLRNKSYYVTLGASAMVSNPCKNMGKVLEMIGDGEIKDVSGFEGIVALNISSWGGGVAPWGNKKEKAFQEPSISDGLVEVFGITGMVHMSNLAGHMTTGTRIGQFKTVSFVTQELTYVQVDGEPFRVPPGNIKIGALPEQVTMLFRPPNMRRVSLTEERPEDS
eukprot:m.82131 g.82131  ORF g.82131 m.82131 type:complete len:974 (-) comp12854_c0_seq2:79-3000(-)